MQIPVLIIAGATSGVGKTTISISIMYALKSKFNLKIQPFKIGPDFIDPSYHEIVTGKYSRTLDAWMMGKRGVIKCLEENSKDADVAVIEGVMGLYDGISGRNEFASSAHMAKIIDAMVILVIDASKASRSIAAIALGFLEYDKEVKIIGIILNNVAGKKHAQYIIDAFNGRIKVPILGIIYRNDEIKVKERHLGLIPADEMGPTKRNNIIKIAKTISEEIDYNKIASLIKLERSNDNTGFAKTQNKIKRVKIALALDSSFNFYYRDNIDVLRNLGAEIEFFSPLHDKRIPNEVSGILIGGGFPEIMAAKLHVNASMIKSIKKLGQQEIPIYGECGGLMYLTKSIIDNKNKSFSMIGLVEAKTVMTRKLTLNYTCADMFKYNNKILNIRGHEFHYSKLENIAADSKYAYRIKRGYGVDGEHDGFLVYDSLVSYMHLHFYDKRFPSKWIDQCVVFSRR